MEFNVFRDYCKAENSEDEDVNHDLQSRLYAEIYYASTDIDNVDTKSDIKSETVNTDDNIIHIDANDSEICYTSVKNNNEDCKKLDNSVNELEDNKPDITSVSVTSTSETCKDKSDKDISAVTVKEEEEGKDIELPNNKHLTSNSVEYVTSGSNCNDIHDIENDIKPKIEDENKEELKLLECSNNEATTNQCVSPNPTIHDSDNNKYQETVSNEKDINNILRKYEFSKSFINKLYLEKYENLEKKLQEVDEEERLKEKQQEEMSVKKSVNDKEMDTKYEVFSTTDKLQKAANYSEEITVLLSETESDSDESILEVPIPPKPQPPIINLKDSDEESEISSNGSAIEYEPSFLKRKKKNSVKNSEKETFIIDQYLESYELNTDSIDDTSGREDIILNCTEVRKGASSIKEIMEMSKSIQSGQHVDKDNTPEIQSPSKIIHVNAIYERDKNESINFAEDVTVTNFLNSHESTPNRKRHYDPCEPCTSDSELCTSVKQRKNIESKDDHSKENNEHDSNTNINQDWEEYFFRPMSEKLKAFYEFQGQQDFDIKEIQNKMSRDPRLWTILDEDLMPELFRHQRYWHMKCTKCHQQGHQRHNCPGPYKPLRCHMCGTQGHTETRCPQKMCLTCGKKQGTFRKTCEACRILHCNMCNAVGHKSTECPDLWRRFHQTTQTCEINIPENLSEVMKPADLLYCCNCTKRGHDSSTCNEYRWSQHFPTPAFVSNYTGELQNEVPTCGNINEDVIPLIKPTKAKCRTFLPDKDDLEGSCVIYSYGTFYTKKFNGEQNVRKLFTLDIQPSHLTSLLNGRVVPTFLGELSKVVQFEIKMYYNVNNELMIRVRSIEHLPQHILELFLYWLKLDDEDKHLKITINLPRKTKKLLQNLKSKIGELQKNLGDPNNICTQIEQLEISLNATQNPQTSVSILKKLMNCRANLRKIYLTKPNNNDLILQLKKCIKHLKKCSVNEVYLEKYLKIIVIYNKIFLPRKLTNTELKRLLEKYYKKRETKRESKKCKSYLALLESLKSTKSNTGCSSKNIKAQGKQTPTVISIEDISVNNNVQSNVQGMTHVESIFNETCTSEKNVTEHVNIDSIVSTQSVCNVSNSNEVVMTKPIQKVNLNTVSSNLITIPLQKSPHNVSLRTPKSVPCAKIKPSENNTEKHSELVNSNNEEAKINKVQEKQDNIIDSETSVTKRKRSKKAKKKLNLENMIYITENKKTDIDTSLENKANEIINEALEFNLPYMNKAVEEVRKKINDKSLKQEHIDTLLRLINLEKDHRKYVSSFYNYLQ
ncbi:Zinc finger CCHC domain-containing protein 7 [Melipona quadrifasciata]|uniref:Zinc finger CCHC domain-containing protein 7 n=1 Tax=Melipona quadrifasciata TaxID=166423 RepID=A0A0M8ZN72_9HYME|nr:Zinc finger CCHC domain-containing protein 7 [Melipona quadrifasciata]